MSTNINAGIFIFLLCAGNYERTMRWRNKIFSMFFSSVDEAIMYVVNIIIGGISVL